MTATGTGRPMPTVAHAQSPSNYVSGHCGSGSHGRCVGAYTGVTCACTCHTPADPPPLVAVHCFFACDHLVLDPDPHTAHQLMEAHYFDAHRPEIAAAVGWPA